jgi:hypothetical protein
MNISTLNSAARPFAKALVTRFPRFRKNLSAEKGGEFEAFVWAPPGSNAGAMVCQSLEGAVWVRFAPGQTGCCCESVPDLLKTVRELLSGKAVITVISKGTQWVETTVHSAASKRKVARGQTAATYSWSSSGKRRRGRRSKAKAAKAK